MFESNHININNLKSITLSEKQVSTTSFQYKQVKNKLELSSEYAKACQEYQQKNKWIMFINPDEASLDQLASFNDIETTKLLCVYIKEERISANNEALNSIKQALVNNTCSTIVVTDTLLSKSQMEELELHTSMVETDCLVLENTQVMH